MEVGVFVESIISFIWTVDVTDFQNFIKGFTGAGSTWQAGNINGDGVIDITEFSNCFLANFVAIGGGTHGPSQVVSKPNAMLLLVLGELLLGHLVRRRLQRA